MDKLQTGNVGGKQDYYHVEGDGGEVNYHKPMYLIIN